MVDALTREKQYNIFTASTGTKALEIVNSQEIHILLLDVILPDINGYELCRRIRNNAKTYPMQILLISGFESVKDLDGLLEAGADDFIHKPIPPLELNARVQAAYIRWRNQANSVEAPKHGSVNALLSENTHLRSEFEKIRILNQELEKTNVELQKLASMDPLSGLLNRRALFQRIVTEIERSLRLDLPLTGIMIDIDHFKRINDNYGHLCGDEVIREIGNTLVHRLRKYDHAGRYGGEEFLVIFPNTTSESALGIAERFRREIEAGSVDCAGESLRFTVSVGVGQYKPKEPAGRWIGRVDGAMYRAKQQGRNRVILE